MQLIMGGGGSLGGWVQLVMGGGVAASHGGDGCSWLWGG